MASHSILGVPAKVLTGRSLKSFLVNPESLKFDKNGIKGTFEIYDFTGNRKFVDCVIQSVEEEGSSAAFEGFVSDVTDRDSSRGMHRYHMIAVAYNFKESNPSSLVTVTIP
jgi:hypothetical protein